MAEFRYYAVYAVVLLSQNGKFVGYLQNTIAILLNFKEPSDHLLKTIYVHSFFCAVRRIMVLLLTDLYILSLDYARHTT